MTILATNDVKGHATLAPPAAAHKLSVLLRVHNDVRVLATLVDRLLSAPLAGPLELVVVDDGSTDGSSDLLEELCKTRPEIRYIRHERSQGDAESLRTAIREMTGELALLLAPDPGFSPLNFSSLIKPVVEGSADVVFGSRFLSHDCRRVSCDGRPFLERLATRISNLVQGIQQTNICPDCMLIRTEILKILPLTTVGTGVENELVAKLAKWKVRIYEVPVTLDAWTQSTSQRFGLGTFCRTVWQVLKHRFLEWQFTSHDGFHILNSVSKAPKFNRWLLSQLSPFFGNRIMEAGSGIGNLTELLIDHQRLACVDMEPLYVERLSQRFGHMTNLSFHQLNLSDLDGSPELVSAELDTIVCVNVLEHIDDDRKVLRNFKQILQPGGQVVLLVPANPRLYSGVDRALGHFRRYTFEEACSKMREAGLDVVHCGGFNRLGAIGWFISGKLLGQTTLSAHQMRLFEWLLPLAKLIEKLPILPQLSVIVVGRKAGAAPSSSQSGGTQSDPISQALFDPVDAQ